MWSKGRKNDGIYIGRLFNEHFLRSPSVSVRACVLVVHLLEPFVLLST